MFLLLDAGRSGRAVCADQRQSHDQGRGYRRRMDGCLPRNGAGCEGRMAHHPPFLPEQHVGTDRLSAHSLGKLPPGRDDHGLLGTQLRSVKHAQRLHGTNVWSGVRLPVRYTA